jgi:hypothetical protein
MADLIREYVDVAAKPGEVYAFIEDPKVGQLFAPSREVFEVVANGHGRVQSVKTRQGTVDYTLHNFPQRWQAEYHRPDVRARFDARCEAYGDSWTRVTIEINLQPQSFRGRLTAPMTRRSFRGHLLQRLAAVQKQFNKK